MKLFHPFTLGMSLACLFAGSIIGALSIYAIRMLVGFIFKEYARGMRAWRNA